MSASVFVSAVKAPDDVWLKHKAVHEACRAADVSLPDETEDYFDGEPPDPKGVSIHLGSVVSGPKHPAAEAFNDEGGWGLYIKLSELPKGTTHIRVEQA